MPRSDSHDTTVSTTDEEPRYLSRRQVAHFRLLRLLGSGGQGEVYEAYDERLHRRVALKLLSRRFETMARATRDLMHARFEREAEVAARVDHPGICSVHEFGEDEGTSWISMRLVEGESLRALIKRRRAAVLDGPEAPSVFGSTTIAVPNGDAAPAPDHAAAPRSRLRTTTGPARPEIESIIEMIAGAARALHCAHEAGLVHRDIKPGNLMVAREGGAVVLDFGLAADANAHRPSLTMTGDFIGTPAYMAPEQIAGRHDVDRRTDVYALGVTLYECLTLCPAFEAPTREALYRKIRLENPLPIRDLNPDISRDLAIVVEAAMDKDADRRYQTMDDFADDLQRVLEHEPIKARPAGPVLRLMRWAQRDPAVATMIAALVVFAVFFSSWTAVKNRELAALNGDLADVNGRLRASNAEVARQARSAARESKARGEALTAKSRALEAERQARTERDAVLAEYERMADTRRLELARAEAETLWPIRPELVGAIDAWQARHAPLLARREVHRETLAALRKRARPYSEEDRRRDFAAEYADIDRLQAILDRVAAARQEGFSPEETEAVERHLLTVENKLARRLETVRGQRSWDFGDDVEAGFRHDVLAGLVREFEAFIHPETGILADLQRRRDRAAAIEGATIVQSGTAWRDAQDRIRRSPTYEGLDLPLQLGLIPLGPDPGSGLEEFLHWPSHDSNQPLPRRNAEGRLTVELSTGIIFVLLPGGDFLMGAQSSNPDDLNHDPAATSEEGPLTEVELAPFFMAKHETTQAQWTRLTGANPSYYDPGSRARGMQRSVTALHPVEQVDWNQARETFAHFELRLPTEAQWEYAARANRPLRFPGTNTVAELRHYANISGVEFADFLKEHSREHRDAFVIHGPVGSFAPNAWGLHDLCGNVFEWCEDRSGPYELPVRGPRGLRSPRGKLRVTRGGSFDMAALPSRLTRRHGMVANVRAGNLGARAARDITRDITRD